jgi:hypothetical protein
VLTFLNGGDWKIAAQAACGERLRKFGPIGPLAALDLGVTEADVADTGKFVAYYRAAAKKRGVTPGGFRGNAPTAKHRALSAAALQARADSRAAANHQSATGGRRNEPAGYRSWTQ